MLVQLNIEKYLLGRHQSRLLILTQHTEGTILVTSCFHNCICEVCIGKLSYLTEDLCINQPFLCKKLQRICDDSLILIVHACGT